MTAERAPRPRRGSGTDDVPSITSAAEPLSADMDRRARRYFVQMSVRVACFLGAVAVDHWSRWVLLVGAVVLPYFAVLLANSVGERRGEAGSFVDGPPLPALPPSEPRS